jgi:Predicted oxidoreductase
MDYLHTKQLIYGCMGLGGGWNSNAVTAADEQQAEAAIEAALSIGITIFDHADIYTNGKAEEVFGRVLKRRPELRSKMVLQSKTGICKGCAPDGTNIYNLSRSYIIEQVAVILERLCADHLDTLLLHRPDVLMRGEEVAEAFAYLKQQGMVNRFGVSNMSVSQVTYLQHFWTEPLVANQLQLSLGHTLVLDQAVSVNTRLDAFDGGMEGMLEYAQLHHIAIQAWSALDKGIYTSVSAQHTSAQRAVAEMVAHLADKYNTTSTAIVLAWLMMIPGNVQPIIGTTKVDRILACTWATTTQLTREEWYGLWIAVRGRKLP